MGGTPAERGARSTAQRGGDRQSRTTHAPIGRRARTAWAGGHELQIVARPRARYGPSGVSCATCVQPLPETRADAWADTRPVDEQPDEQPNEQATRQEDGQW